MFVVDKGKQLRHIEILGDEIVNREILGIIETKPSEVIDAVEHPIGKLRVLAGNKQYVQVAPDRRWHEIKENRCTRFVPLADDLFCSFVIKGEEIAAPERTDYTVGWCLIAPIFFWSHEHASKIVLAQESPDDWIVRAVVDPETPMDAGGDFMVGTDSLGNIHFLYFTSRGGGAFFFFAYGYSGAGGIREPKSELRCAHLTIDGLLSQPTDAQNAALTSNQTPMKWVSVKGTALPNKPLIKKDLQYDSAIAELRPLNNHFSVNKVTGEVNGLMGTSGLWMELSLHDDKWRPYYNVVTTDGFPNSNWQWFPTDNPFIKIDGKGTYHVLLKSVERKSDWSSAKRIMNYFYKKHNDWSAPLKLGNSHWYDNIISLAVGDSGVSFAAWVNEEGRFIGRWIRPH